MKQDFLQELGYLGFTMRLKRLSDKLLQDGRRLYKTIDFDIEPNWYGIFILLQKEPQLTVTEIADHLDLSHASAIASINKMIKNGYLEAVQGSKDKRKRQLSLTQKALDKLPAYSRLWDAGRESVSQLLEGTNLLAELTLLENQLKEQDFEARTLRNWKTTASAHSEVKIHTYQPAYAKDFKRLNYEWLLMYFRIEAEDVKILESPQSYVIDRGGQIFFALLDGIVVGTVSLLEVDQATFELAKMAVSPMYKGKKIGQKLMDAAVEYAKTAGKKRLFLESNRKLIPALRLYEKVGFREVPITQETPYVRADIHMEMELEY